MSNCKPINLRFPGPSFDVCALANYKKVAYTASYFNTQGVGRTFTGLGNNLLNPNRGAVGTALLRKSFAQYDDGVSTFTTAGEGVPTARTVSNYVCKQPTSILNSLGLKDMTWAFGQLVDHELDLTQTQTSGETADILTEDDGEEDYIGRTISFSRSEFLSGSPRQHPNQISAFIDGTNIYGFSDERAMALRCFDGSGKLLTVLDDTGGVIPIYNTNGLANAIPTGADHADFFLSGDIRANENVLLTSMHTLFIREHNRLCDEIVSATPAYSGNDEVIYQYARHIVVGQMQSIIYNEFLPALIGNVLTPYTGYNFNVDPSIATEFSTVGFRIGHTMLSPNLKIGTSGSLPLRNAFFSPSYVQANGIEDLLLGGCLQTMQEIDGKIVDDVRNFLFGPPTMSSLLDLAALNIQRGRDHGIPKYNDVREAYGLTALSNFNQITSDVAVQTALSNVYGSPDDIDPWVGGIVETHVAGTAVGPLFTEIMKDQFERLRDGDRFWYQINPCLSQSAIQEIHNTKLSEIIIRNCSSINAGDIPVNVFTGV